MRISPESLTSTPIVNLSLEFDIYQAPGDEGSKLTPLLDKLLSSGWSFSHHSDIGGDCVAQVHVFSEYRDTLSLTFNVGLSGYVDCLASEPGLYEQIGAVEALLLEIPPREIAVTATFLIPLNDLPPRGFVRESMDVRTAIGGDRLTLTGAEWSLTDSPRESIAWVLDQSNDPVLKGTIKHIMIQSPHNDDFIHDGLRSVLSRLNRIVFERPE